jgi:hypothetical protein
MTENNYPDKPCGACKGTKFWQRLPSRIGEKRGTWTCCACHPMIDGVPGDVYEIKPDITQERDALITRVRNGLDKMWQAWAQIKNMVPEKDDPQFEAKNNIWKNNVQKWVEAENRLWAMIQELNLKYDYEECVFMVDGKKSRKCLGLNPSGAWCVLCTCDKVRATKFWEDELGFKNPEARAIHATSQP